jgi:hypothetical protein
MTPPTPNRSLPGTLFLNFARLIFPAQIIASIFTPAVADLREELREAGTSRIKRFAVRCRWYWALCSLVMIAPLSVRTSPISGSVDAVVAVPNGGWLLVLLAATLYVGTWSFFGSFVISAASAGVALAFAMRRWHDTHPAVVVEPWRLSALPTVQINLSAIRVAGDGPGLIFAGGTVLIFFVGLPGLWWFFVAAALGSLLVAWGLFIRRSTGHSGLLNSIRCR